MFRVLRFFLILFLAIPFFLDAQVTTNGIVLHLDANNSSSYSGSGNTWIDLSGNNYHVSLNGPQFQSTNQTIAKHFSFDGNNDFRAKQGLN